LLQPIRREFHQQPGSLYFASHDSQAKSCVAYYQHAGASALERRHSSPSYITIATAE
jgi:hypothetical protein